MFCIELPVAAQSSAKSFDPVFELADSESKRIVQIQMPKPKFPHQCTEYINGNSYGKTINNLNLRVQQQHSTITRPKSSSARRFQMLISNRRDGAKKRCTLRLDGIPE